MRTLISTGWLESDGEYVNGDAYGFCINGIREHFDLPRDIRRIRFRAFAKKTRFSIPIVIYWWTDMMVFRTLLKNNVLLHETDEDDERFLKRRSHLVDKTLYVECEWE